MSRRKEKISDAIRNLGGWGWFSLLAGIVTLGIGARRLSVRATPLGWMDVLWFLVWTGVCLLFLFLCRLLLDVHTYPLSFVMAITWLYFALKNPHMCVITGVAMLALASVPFVSGLRSFIENDLIRAVHKGQTEKVRALLDAGADVNTTEKGKTALMEATQRVDAEMVALLLAAGADANARGSHGYTPLGRAVWKGNVGIVRALLAAGADVNARNDMGNTPLLNAVSSEGNAEVVQTLLAAGADVNARNQRGDTPLLKASSPLCKAEVVETLLDAGADINARDQDGNTPLLVAVFWRPKLASLLIRKGADVNARNRSGGTAMSKAALLLEGKEREEIVALLKTAGASS